MHALARQPRHLCQGSVLAYVALRCVLFAVRVVAHIHAVCLPWHSAAAPGCWASFEHLGSGLYAPRLSRRAL